MILERIKDPEVWSSIRNSPHHKFLIDKLFEMYDEYCTGDIPVLRYSVYNVYYKSGSRMAFEDAYFHRRHRMNTLAILCMLYPENESYLTELQDIIWAVCDEYAWSVPAHNKITDNLYIDLFGSETAFRLSEIWYMLSDRFDDVVNDRIVFELKRRIVDSFESREFYWENETNNWAAVCIAGVAVTYMYAFPQRFDSIIPRMKRILNSYLNGFKDDGICSEGNGYWNYGFGFYTALGKRLYDFTDGKENLFTDKKIHQIALHLQNVMLERDITVSFSDTGMYTNYNLALVHFLHKLYDDIECRSLSHAATSDPAARWPLQVESFLEFNPDYVSEEMPPPKDVFLKDTCWFLKRTLKYSFATKGGDNIGPHNHNDIGSFIFACNNKQVLCDLGSGEYIKGYFREQRYTFLVNSSRGHSVPIINGQYQVAKRCRPDNIIYDNSVVTVDMKDAYEIQELQQYTRTFDFGDNGITVTDNFAFDKDDNTVVLRFVSQEKPEQTKEGVVIDGVILRCDLPVTFSDEKYSGHYGDEKTAYFTGFTVNCNKKGMAVVHIDVL